MKLVYFFQSGFLIENDDFLIIIDYYKAHDLLKTELLDKIKTTTKCIYVLVTHSHYDHFNEEILDWSQLNKNIRYIFSEEMRNITQLQSSINNIVFLKKGEKFRDHLVFIQTFGSTDIGASFYIECDNKKIFHAGDLNNWHWNEEADAKFVNDAEIFYLRELDYLADSIKTLDILMYPIDPRLGKDLLKGLIQFLEKIKVKMIVPMHFGNQPPNHSLIQEQLHKIDKNINYLPINKEKYTFIL